MSGKSARQWLFSADPCRSAAAEPAGAGPPRAASTGGEVRRSTAGRRARKPKRSAVAEPSTIRGRQDEPVRQDPRNSIFKETQQLGRQGAALGLGHPIWEAEAYLQGAASKFFEAFQTVEAGGLVSSGWRPFRSGDPRPQGRSSKFSKSRRREREGRCRPWEPYGRRTAAGSTGPDRRPIASCSRRT
jgi:hypothetical protein